MYLTAALLFAALFTFHPVSSHSVHDIVLQARAASATFNHTGTTGPLGWTALDKAKNGACSTGTRQSPINLDSSITTSALKPKLTIPDAVQGAHFVNMGYTVEVETEGKMSIGSDQYKLAQFHFHTPSEHRLDYEYFPLEMHMVFDREPPSAPKRFVLGVLFELDKGAKTTGLLTTLVESIGSIPRSGDSTTTKKLTFNEITSHFETQPLFQYEGSLTTPPCTEGITWLVAKKTLPLDVVSFLAFKNVMKFNSRYTQNTPGKDNLIKYAKDNYPPA